MGGKFAAWPFLIVEAGLFAVDTFFFVGGFLVAYVFLREHVKTGLKYPLAILNRYLRFVPSYLLAILLFYSIMPHLGSGPYWNFQIAQVNNCDRIWKPLLFVDNLVDNGATQCMGWGWYLQNDMQLFIYSVFLLLIYEKSRTVGYLTIFFSVAASFAFNMQQTFDNQYRHPLHITDMANWGNYMLDVYMKPWARCPPYLYGLALGLLYM